MSEPQSTEGQWERAILEKLALAAVVERTGPTVGRSLQKIPMAACCVAN